MIIMKTEKQKDIFLKSEGDNWFRRNKSVLDGTSIKEDIVLKEILPLVDECLKNKEVKEKSKYSIFEIGCGNGVRLKELSDLGYAVTGIDPSAEAIKDAKGRGLDAFLGTADELSFPDNKFDMVIFGFCLYLCDRDDLFKIAAEANRVLKHPGYLVIYDFYSKNAFSNNYHHLEGIKSYKMDYTRCFDWHPDYMLVKHTLGSEEGFKPTDNKNELLTVSVLRKV